MRFITVMDYHTEPYITMCKGWFHFVRKYHPNAEIVVYHSSSMDSALIRDDVIYKKLDITDVPVLISWDRGKVNKLAVHKEWEKYDNFIFMDADAYPLDDLTPLYDACTKPVTFCGHEPQIGLGPIQLNSGVFVQKEPFFHYDQLIQAYKDNGNKLKYSGSDQSLAQQHFESIDYDPFDWDVMGHEYNSAAKADITIDTDKITAISKVTGKNIKVLHGFGEFKFWKHAPEFWEYVKGVV